MVSFHTPPDNGSAHNTTVNKVQRSKSKSKKNLFIVGTL